MRGVVIVSAASLATLCVGGSMGTAVAVER
jgi:acetyl-CoA acetyltransferase